MNKLRGVLVSVLCIIFTWAWAQGTPPAPGQDPAPLAMLKQTVDRLLGTLKQNRARLKTDEQLIYKIVDQVLLPHVDLEGMSRAVIGPRYWQQANTPTKQRFMRVFTHYVTQTYSAALTGYQDERVRFFPIRGGVTGTRVVVHSQIVQKDGPPIALDYRVVLLQGGDWKVYDFSVDNVSLVQSYRAQFESALAQGGLAHLVSRLEARVQGERP